MQAFSTVDGYEIHNLRRRHSPFPAGARERPRLKAPVGFRRAAQAQSPAKCLVESIEQRARHLGVTPLTIRRRIRSGQDAAFRVGGTWRLPLAGDDLGDLPSECSVRQIANTLGVSELTVRRWIAAGEVPAAKDGGAWAISRRFLEDLFKVSTHRANIT
jgi:excisionase family DNA binding protein